MRWALADQESIALPDEGGYYFDHTILLIQTWMLKNTNIWFLLFPRASSCLF